MAVSSDLLKDVVAPLRDALEPLLRAPVPAPAAPMVGHLLDLGGLAALAAVLAGIGLGVRRLGERSAAVGLAMRAGCAVLAVGFAAWLVRNPSPGFEGLFTRWDHLALAAFGGLALEGAPGWIRKAGLVAVSLGVLLQYAGAHAVLGVGGACLAGALLVRGPLRSRPWVLVAVQAALFVGVYVWGLRMRTGSGGFAALQVQGLLAFAALRQASFLVEAVRAPRRLVDWAAYLTFYPGAFGLFGAPEVYAEFSRRNLARDAAPDPRRAVRRVALGAAQTWLALAIPVSVDDVLAAGGPLLAWPTAIALFLRTALAVMGGWALIDGVALFFGVQLRANFRGLLGCQNPSELWWAWRGTLTNWLVQHVYAPLGARRHAVRNIAAAFAVSFLWHIAGLPFVSGDFTLVQVLPIALWAAINGLGVVLHVTLPPTPDGGVAGHTVRTVLMWALGALTPILLHFQGPAFARFPEVFPALLGLPR
ncbi:MAG: hypothetical protein KIT14_13830 [bacterium]|nr:hypothetical protein [bacterium]